MTSYKSQIVTLTKLTSFLAATTTEPTLEAIRDSVLRESIKIGREISLLESINVETTDNPNPAGG